MEMRGKVVSSSRLIDHGVRSPAGEDLGKIEELMVDTDTGRIAYAVLSFGGFLGMGNKLFAIPWKALRFSTVDDMFVLDIPKDRLKEAPGFDKDNWPDTADVDWSRQVHAYYGIDPYWEK